MTTIIPVNSEPLRKRVGLLTQKEVASILSIDRAWFNELVRQGRIKAPGVQLEGFPRMYYTPADLVEVRKTFDNRGDK